MPKPYDQSFKLLADDDPRSAMAIFAGIPLDAELEVRAADRELNLPALQVDHLYRCKQAGEEFLVHFEAVSRFRPAVLDRQVDYVRAIIAKFKMPCRSYLLLLTEGGVPRQLPRHLECRYGDYDSRVRLRAVRLWKIPARRVLRMGRLPLLPWTALMSTTPPELAEAWQRLAASGDRTLYARMALFSGLRYGNNERVKESVANMTTEEILQDSWVYHDWVARGERRGLQHSLTTLLTARFGPLPKSAEERIQAADIATLNAWTIRILAATSIEDCLQ